jgi:hypothetical protein
LVQLLIGDTASVDGPLNALVPADATPQELARAVADLASHMDEDAWELGQVWRQASLHNVFDIAPAERDQYPVEVVVTRRADGSLEVDEDY